MKKLLVILSFLLISTIMHSQVLMDKDSLLKQLPMVKEDTVGVQLYINLGQQYESNQPEIAKDYYRRAGRLSEKIDYPQGIIKYINNYTFVLNMQGIYDSSLLLNLQAVNIAKTLKDSVYLAITLFNTGTSYRQLEDYENAVKYYEEGKKIFDKYGNEFNKAQCGDILQLLYYQMKNFEKAISYGEQAVAYFRKVNDPVWLGYAISNLGLSYASLKKYDKSLGLFNEALVIGQKINDFNMISTQYLNIGNIFIQKREYTRLKVYMQNALNYSKKIDNAESIAIAYKGLSYYYTFIKEYDRAEKYADSSLLICRKYEYKSLQGEIYTQLSNLAYARQDMIRGEYFAELSQNISESLINDEVIRNTQRLEKEYELQKKEDEIHDLTTENQLKELSIQRNRVIIVVLIGGIFALFLIVYLVQRLNRQKQVLQEKRIRELETEKMLSATEAVLKGEEQERTRIAKDLHDGLGGMLSGIKHSFTTMKGNLIMTPENQQAFERSMDMLDSSIKEMRRVAHNMMPESLVRFGLNIALKDFCNDINQSGALKIDYQSFDLEQADLDQTLSITVYRIIQELINNILKHAQATQAIVQLVKTGEKLTITVEDDGKGFDVSLLNSSKGVGWINIKNRVDFLKGILDITSRKDEGTSVQIELNF